MGENREGKKWIIIIWIWYEEEWICPHPPQWQAYTLYIPYTQSLQAAESLFVSSRHSPRAFPRIPSRESPGEATARSRKLARAIDPAGGRRADDGAARVAMVRRCARGHRRRRRPVPSTAAAAVTLPRRRRDHAQGLVGGAAAPPLLLHLLLPVHQLQHRDVPAA
jgi:hypothetical protein